MAFLPLSCKNTATLTAVYQTSRKEEILKRRVEKKRLTLERRKKYNLEGNANKNNDPDQYQVANLNNAEVSKKVWRYTL